MTNEIKLFIQADGSEAIEGINKVTGAMKKMEADTSGIIDKIKASWLGISATIYASVSLIEKAWGLVEKAAGFEEQKASLDALAGAYNTNANKIISDIQRASNGLISMSDAVDVAAQAMVKGLNPEQIEKLSAAAETLSNVTGQKAAVEFRNLAEAIALGRERALEASVGIIDLNAKFGDQALKMTDVQKAAARYDEVMRRVNNIQTTLGESTDSLSDKMERFNVQIEDIKLRAGVAITRIAAGLLGVWDSFVSIVNGLAAEILKPFALIEKGLNKLGIGGTIWQQALKDQQLLVEYYKGTAKENFDLMIAQADELMGVRAKRITNLSKSNITNTVPRPVDSLGSTNTSLKLSEYQPFSTLTGFYPAFANADLSNIKDIKPAADEAKKQLTSLQIAAQETARALQWSFVSFFDITSSGFMKFGELAKNILNDISMNLLELATDRIVYSASLGLESLFGFLGFHQGGQVLHDGGVVGSVPRFHAGGLRGDERLTINKVGERYITQEQNAWLTRQANAGGGDIKVNIQMENKTGLPLGIRQTGQKIDERTKVKTLILELAYSDIGFINGLKGAMSR